MLIEEDMRGSISLWGLWFDANGWGNRFVFSRRRPWSAIREMDLKLSGHGRGFGYRLEIVDDKGRSRVLRLKGGLKTFHRLARILDFAASSSARIAIEVFASDILDVAQWKDDETLFAEELCAYDLERRCRYYLLALENELALQDARTLLERFPHRERVARSLILKSLLLSGRMREAREELNAFRDPAGRIDVDAEVEYAIVALYKGRKEGEAMAKRLLAEGRHSCVELVGLEFSRYLSDRSRFKEALSALRLSENRTKLADVDLFKTLLAARGEVLNKRDYRYYRMIGFFLKAEVKRVFFVGAYLAGLLWIVLPKSEVYQKIEERIATRGKLEAEGVRGVLDPETIGIVESQRGVAVVRYGYYRNELDASRSQNLVIALTEMFGHEARRFVDRPNRGEVRYLPNAAGVSVLGPEDASRVIVDWYSAFERGELLAYFLCFGGISVCIVVLVRARG